MEDKKGAMPVNVIIMIILGVIVMVILIIGFYAGWGTLAPWLSSDNVDTVIGSCNTACSTQSTFSYCGKNKELNTGETEIESTCFLLEKISDFDSFGLEPCNINCDVACADVSVKVNGKSYTAVEADATAGCDANTHTQVTGVTVTAAKVCCIPKLPEIK